MYNPFATVSDTLLAVSTRLLVPPARWRGNVLQAVFVRRTNSLMVIAEKSFPSLLYPQCHGRSIRSFDKQKNCMIENVFLRNKKKKIIALSMCQIFEGTGYEILNILNIVSALLKKMIYFTNFIYKY